MVRRRSPGVAPSASFSLFYSSSKCSLFESSRLARCICSRSILASVSRLSMNGHRQ